MKKLRKKKEEKGEEESDKDRFSKFTREPRKKKESPTSRSRVAKGPKKQQGGGAAPTSLQAPVHGTSCPHAPCPAAAIRGPGVYRGFAHPWRAFWPKPIYTQGRKGAEELHARCWLQSWACVGTQSLGTLRCRPAGATNTLDMSLEQKDGVGKK